MDESERLVEHYLRALGKGSVVFEPNGNIPPDFALAGTIGVEVRRLNQNYKHPDGSTKGLEELSIPLWQRLKNSLSSIGPSIDGESWFVGMNFCRPIDPWKPLWVKIQQELDAFMIDPNRQQRTISVTNNFELDLVRASEDHGTFFLLGASIDEDSGGFVMGEVEKNLRLCIAEKEKKIAPYRKRYAEWWLILPDHIAYGMDLEDRETFRAEITSRLPRSFDKVVLLDPRNHCSFFEI